MLITIIILAISAIFFVSGKIRSDLVALCALVALLLCHILTPEEALSGFSSSVVIMMIGLFVVGGAIFQTGLAKIISSRILKLAGKSETRLFLLVILATAAIGAFVSNTGTVALMLPIVVSLAMSAGMNPSRLLMPLAFASSMGGMMTLIGTPPNLVIQDTLTAAGYEPLSFFSFLPVGLVCLLVGIIVLMPLSKLFLSGRKKREDDAKSGKSLKQLVNEYGLSHNLVPSVGYRNFQVGRFYGNRARHPAQVWAEHLGDTPRRPFAPPLPENDCAEVSFARCRSSGK